MASYRKVGVACVGWGPRLRSCSSQRHRNRNGAPQLEGVALFGVPRFLVAVAATTVSSGAAALLGGGAKPIHMHEDIFFVSFVCLVFKSSWAAWFARV